MGGRTGSRTNAEISRPERGVFAAGDIFGGGGAAILSVLYLIYLTDVVGINAAVAGAAILISKFWDAFNDPLMGLISDNTRTRWGRRRPYLLVGGPLIVVGLAVLWAPVGSWLSPTAKTVFVIGAFLFYNTISTIVAVPYSSLSAEITNDLDQRNKVNVLRLAFSTVSSASCTLAASALFGAFRSGRLSVGALYAVLVLGFGALFGVPVFLVGLLTRERAPIPADKVGFSLAAFLAPLQVDAFRKLLGLYLCQALVMDVISATVLYFATYVVNVNATVFLAVFVVINLVAFPIVSRLVQRVDKGRIYRTFLPVAMLAVAGVALYPSGWPAVGVYVLALVMAASFSGAQLMSWVMFPDVVDAGEDRFGERNAGGFSGLMTLIRGLATALAIQGVSLVLYFSRYRPNAPSQPASALWGIRLTMLVVCVGLMVTGWFIARRYPLTRAEVTRIRDRLDRRRMAATAPPSAEPAPGSGTPPSNTPPSSTQSPTTPAG